MYRVELEQFEGPMDLLLFFIKRDEIDIYDIPIARIADEYLTYVRVMEEIDLDGVGDFIYMAALLINIKARMLLPSQDADEEGEAVDPRRELVERLLEYVRFKEAADQLSTRRERRREHFVRGDASADRERVEESHEVEVDASVFELVEALGRVLEADEDDDESEPIHEVAPLEHTVEEQQRYVVERLRRDSQVSFRTLIRGESRGFVIATFLALLELTRQQHLRLRVAERASDFSVEARDDAALQSDRPPQQVPPGLQGDGAVGPPSERSDEE
ncbi:segregation and condensation protein A [Salinibacter altiplanensis]|uniref:segregation and condensation protein A n=1 Tax=Salinibacter altiplanensis TaxID=1803181 RepID=UPI000C9FDE95|nr:segregation/condensation protein A [Salinibacter altiplanensis]